MIATIQPAPAQRVEADFCPALKNPAVALCTEAWEKILRATLEKTRNPYTAKRFASIAYRTAMPPLSGYQDIRDFIACAGYGMLLGAIKAADGTRLLYAAQVALATVPKESRVQTRTQAQTAARPSADPTPLPFFAATPAKEKD